MAFFDKVQEMAGAVADAASDTAKSTKIKAKIREEKHAIDEDLQKLGMMYFDMLKSGAAEANYEASALLASVDGHQAVIAECKQQLDALKVD